MSSVAIAPDERWALYKQADVVVFDEATSALDNETEAAVIEAINAIDGDITVLMVAHRLSTLEACDVLYELEAGEIKLWDSRSEIVPDFI